MVPESQAHLSRTMNALKSMSLSHIAKGKVCSEASELPCVGPEVKFLSATQVMYGGGLIR